MSSEQAPPVQEERMRRHTRGAVPAEFRFGACHRRWLHETRLRFAQTVADGGQMLRRRYRNDLDEGLEFPKVTWIAGIER